MAERIYPASRPNTLNPPPQSLNGATAAAAPAFPATKSQLYGASRPQYRPQSKPYRRRRSCCCRCCLWITLFIIVLIVIAAIVGVAFWVIYHPERPSFSVKTIRINQFNITTPKNSSPVLNSNIDVTISSRNPNKRITFIYNPISISLRSNGVDVGNGTFPQLVHGTKNTTSLKAVVKSGGRDLDSDSVKSLNSDLKKSSGLPLEIELNTKVKVKIGGVKTKTLPIRVICKGVEVTVAKGKNSPSTMKSRDAKCKVNLRIKIWKWTF